jgi:poly(3-hydroxybutyrate) depolymerase
MMHRHALPAVSGLAAALLVVLPVSAQRLPAGPQVLTFHSDVDDTEQPYGLYLPRNFDEQRAYPLVVMLHGAGSNHRLALRRVFGRTNAPGETDVEASRVFPDWPDRPVIVATPFVRGTMGYQGVAEKDVLDVVADVKRRFRIDDDRTYLTGLSMGGGGTLWLGLSRPDLWAAIAPVCPAPPPGTDDLVPNALNVPVRVFQGGADPVVRAEGTRGLVERLTAAGASVEYTEFPGVGHDSWDPAYRDGAIFDWFARFTRVRWPGRVHFVTARYETASAYWVTIDRLTPGTPASIEAEVTAPNRITVRTNQVGAFTVRLDGHPRFDARQAVDVVVDGARLQMPGGASLSFRRDGDGWIAGRDAPGPGEKQRGAEGPIAEALASRHVYVYGTGGAPGEAELAARRAVAERAADWSVHRGPFLGRVMVFPRVVADRELRPSDLADSNLVLFGTAATNEAIARLADRLPLRLDPADSEIGLVYVVPVDGRYVVVNSGRPWWEGMPPPGPGPARAPSGRPRGFAFMGLPAGLLMGLGDYVVFRGNLDQIVVEGRFDARWRLAAPEVALLEAAGVTVTRR